MEKLYLDPSWSFRECVYNIRALKSQYQGVLMSFSYTQNTKGEIRYIRETRNTIYELPYDEWKKDKLWEYMNDDVDYITIMCIK